MQMFRPIQEYQPSSHLDVKMTKDFERATICSPVVRPNTVLQGSPRSSAELFSEDVPKFRQLPCRTFISVGTCPYRDRCVYLHDPRLVCKDAKTKTRKKNKEDIVQDSLFWPVLSFDEVNQRVDCNHQPLVVQQYDVPRPQDDQYRRHDQAVYSLWMHFVTFCSGMDPSTPSHENEDFRASSLYRGPVQGSKRKDNSPFLKETEVNNAFTKVSRLHCFRELSLGKNQFLLNKSCVLATTSQDHSNGLRDQYPSQRTVTTLLPASRHQPPLEMPTQHTQQVQYEFNESEQTLMAIRRQEILDQKEMKKLAVQNAYGSMLENPGPRAAFLGPAREPVFFGSGPFLGPSGFNPVTYIPTLNTHMGQRYHPQVNEYDERHRLEEGLKRQKQLQEEFQHQEEERRQRRFQDYQHHEQQMSLYHKKLANMSNSYDPQHVQGSYVPYRPRPVEPQPVDPRSLGSRPVSPRSVDPRFPTSNDEARGHVPHYDAPVPYTPYLGHNVNYSAVVPMAAAGPIPMGPTGPMGPGSVGMGGSTAPSMDNRAFFTQDISLASMKHLSVKHDATFVPVCDVHSPVTVSDTRLSPCYDGKEGREGKESSFANAEYKRQSSFYPGQNLINELGESKLRIDEYQRQYIYAQQQEHKSKNSYEYFPRSASLSTHTSLTNLNSSMDSIDTFQVDRYNPSNSPNITPLSHNLPLPQGHVPHNGHLPGPFPSFTLPLSTPYPSFTLKTTSEPTDCHNLFNLQSYTDDEFYKNSFSFLHDDLNME